MVLYKAEYKWMHSNVGEMQFVIILLIIIIVLVLILTINLCTIIKNNE